MNYFLNKNTKVFTHSDYPNWLFYKLNDLRFADYDQENNEICLNYKKIWSFISP